MQHRENADMLFRVETAIKTDYLGYEQSARERRGAAAWGLTKDTADWWDKNAATHTDNLQNPEQKRLFSQTVAKLRTQSLDGISHYEGEQKRVSLEESTKSSIASSINLAAANAQQWRAGDLATQAAQTYGFVRKNNPVVITTPQSDRGYAETWHPGDKGDEKYPRPKEIPLDRNGVQIFRPDKFSADDLAGEMLHVDPKAQQASDAFAKSLTSAQLAQVKETPDYQQENTDESAKLRSGVDSVIRGYVVGQWPQKALNEFGFTSEQKKILDDLKQYMQQQPEGAPPLAGDPVSAAKSDILKRVQVLAQVNGWLPPRRQAEEEHQLTNLHSQVIQNLANTDPSKAKAYYEANKPEINGSQYDTIDKLLKTAGVMTTAQQAADAVMAMEMPEDEALATIRQNYSGEEQHAAVLEVKTRFQEQVQNKELAQKKAGDTAYDIFAKTHRIGAIPADVLNGMDGKVRLALEHEAQLLSEDKLPKTDFDKYYSLRQLAFDNPAAFARRDLRQDFPYLGKSERESMIDLQAKVNKPDEMKDVATLENQLSNIHDQLNWGANDREKKGAFDIAAQNAINSEEKRTGKKPNFEERQKIIDRLVIEGDTNGPWIPFGNKRYYEVQGTPDEAKFVPVVPKVERAKIEDALKRNKIKVDEATVIRLYKKKMGLQ